MKVVAFNGSPRKNGNTAQSLQIVLEEVKAEGIEVELVNIAQEHLEPCHACGACGRNKDRKCIYDDRLNEYVEMMAKADGILLGSPTYFGTMSAQMKAFIDRAGFVNRANGDLFKRKVGAAVAVNRRAGAIQAFSDMNYFFLIGHMIVPGSSYWNVVNALKPGEVHLDEEGVRTMKDLGKNMAWLIKKLNA
ncbi:MAG: Iron-sulfur flavoprotein [Methanomassiliicoccales archaeon PtaU1.Bin124]|nr:MAG: Iron-sulfur flavoprotein [Methanomassiliicoccales archaeon PtaU1.Bin124]